MSSYSNKFTGPCRSDIYIRDVFHRVIMLLSSLKFMQHLHQAFGYSRFIPRNGYLQPRTFSEYRISKTVLITLKRD